MYPSEWRILVVARFGYRCSSLYQGRSQGYAPTGIVKD